MESNSINTNLNIEELTPSDWPTIESMIKVIGVGGGGCNAVNYMFRENIQGCSFYVCNTDRQALDCSPVHAKIHIGSNALGAGTVPAEGRKAAIESLEEIEKTVLTPETKMLFITAGMGGGTGTGAAPVIAKAAKDRGILTVAVVTIPYEIEGITPLAKAIDGIHELKNNVDSLLVINNEKHQHRLQGHHDNDEGQWHGLDGLRCRQRQEQDRGCRQRSSEIPSPKRLQPHHRQESAHKHHSGQEQGRSDDG